MPEFIGLLEIAYSVMLWAEALCYFLYHGRGRARTPDGPL